MRRERREVVGSGPFTSKCTCNSVTATHTMSGGREGALGQVCEPAAACSPWPCSWGLPGHWHTEGVNLRGAKPVPADDLEQAGSLSLLASSV